MEQLQRDKDYSAYLLRLVGNELSVCKSREELVQFINNLNRSINSDEVIRYVNSNGLIFDYQEFNKGIDKLLEQYDRMHEFKVNKNFGSNVMVSGNYNFIPITKISIENISQELIEKVNYLIVNPRINPNDFHVDINSQTFVNIKDNVLYNVIKDADGNYQLVNKDGSNKIEVVKEEPSKKIENTILLEKNIEIDDNVEKKDSKFKLFMNKLTPVLSNGFVSTMLLTLISAVTGIVLATILVAHK